MKTMDIKRGGARPGAGRKALAPEERRVPVTFSVPRQDAQMLREMRAGGYPINEIVGRIICAGYRAFSFGYAERLDLDARGIASQASANRGYFADSE